MLSPYNVCYRFREKRQRKKDYQPLKQRCRRKGNKKIALGGQATYMHGWHCYRSFANGHSGGFNGHTEACSEQSFCNTDTLASRQTALAAERLWRLFEERQRSRSLSDFLWSLGHSVRFVCEMWIDHQMWWHRPVVPVARLFHCLQTSCQFTFVSDFSVQKIDNVVNVSLHTY